MALAKSQQSLKSWTKQKWRTKSGKPSAKTGERYLPEKAIKSLTRQNMLLQLGLREKAHARENSLYANLNLLLKRLQNFAEAGDDPRDVRLADVEPDIDNRVYLLRKNYGN